MYLNHVLNLCISADTFREGIIQPTLIQQLKRILDQYPDDGQILKVLEFMNVCTKYLILF